MTRAQLRAVVQKALGNRTEDDTINTGLDLGLQEMVQRHGWKSLWTEVQVSIAQGDTSVALPVLPLRVIDARLLLGSSLRGKRMTIKAKQWVTQRMPDVQQLPQAQPWLAYYESTGGIPTFYFGPPANQAYTIVFTIVYDQPSYSSDSMENPIPLSDHAQIAYATMFAKRSLGQFDQADQWEKQFEKQFMICMRHDLDRKANDLAMDEFSPRDQRDGYPDGGSQPWLDPFYSGGSRGWSNDRNGGF